MFFYSLTVIIVFIPEIMNLFFRSLDVILFIFSINPSKSRRQFFPPSNLFKIATILPSSASWHLRYGIEMISLLCSFLYDFLTSVYGEVKMSGIFT